MHLALFVVGMLALLQSLGCITRIVSVTSTPNGARVFVDGTEKGNTPLEQKLSWPNEDTVHRIDVRMDEYESQSSTLTTNSTKTAPEPPTLWSNQFTLIRLDHTVDVRFESTPPGAEVYLSNRKVGVTPCNTPVRFSRPSSRSSWGVIEATVRLTDYFEADSRFDYDESVRGPCRIQLERSAQTLEVGIESSPTGADISIDGESKGKTPLRLPIVFTRKTASSTWRSVALVANLEDYLPTSMNLDYDSAAAGSPAKLSLTRIRHEVPINFICNEDAEVVVDDHVVGKTNATHKLTFTRPDATSPWKSFLVTIRKDGYRWRRPGGSASPGDTSPFTATFTYEDSKSGELRVELEPIRFVWTKLRYYTFTDDQIGIAEERVLAQVGDIEREPMVQSVTRMTDYPAGGLMDTRLWVAPPEQQLLFSVEVKSQKTQMTKEGSSNLWRQAGQGLTRLTDGPALDVEACVSSDGKYAYFSSNRLLPKKMNIWRAMMSGQGGFTKITDSPSSEFDLYPMVSPDGNRIVFSSKLHGVTEWQIWVASADGTLPTQLRVGMYPSWSPDGKRIGYVSRDDLGFEQIWVMNDDASKPTQLTTGNAAHQYPIWTPDGTRLVYSSNEAINAEGKQNFDIWIMNVDGTNRTQLTVNGSWDNRPSVSSDGKYIYFLSNRGAKESDKDNWQIWRIQLK
mgnify:FL=1